MPTVELQRLDPQLPFISTAFGMSSIESQNDLHWKGPQR